MQAVFYRGHGFSAWLVRAVSAKPYAHCACLIDGVVYEAVMPLVRARPWGTPEDLAATIRDVPGGGERDALLFLVCQLGKPYDLGGILLYAASKYFPMARRVPDETKLFWECYRLTDWACQKHGWRGPVMIDKSPGGLCAALTGAKG